MRVRFVGEERLGSVAIRALQMSTLRPDWTWSATLEPDDFLDNDLFCFVKRPQKRLMRFLRSLGKTVVYDVLDSWMQPEDDERTHDRESALKLFGWLGRLPVDGVIFPNQAMQEDLGDLVPNPATLYHHYRPGLRPARFRTRARTVGYEGQTSYLGEWRSSVERACRNLGLEFVCNPKDLGALDIGFAARGRPFSSYLSRRYKSNVKLANFYGAGIPCLVAPEVSYKETDNGAVRFCERPSQVESALRELLPEETRRQIRETFLATRQRFSIGTIATQLEDYFAQVRAG